MTDANKCTNLILFLLVSGSTSLIDVIVVIVQRLYSRSKQSLYKLFRKTWVTHNGYELEQTGSL